MPTENTIRKSRMDYIDIYRAFGIILMVMGHIGFGGKFDKFIHAFHMPMFFFISGFFYKEKCIDLLLRKLGQENVKIQRRLINNTCQQ